MSTTKKIMLGVPAAAQALMLLGKLSGLISASWFIVLIPFIAVFGIGLLAFIGGFVYGLIRYYAGKEVH